MTLSTLYILLLKQIKGCGDKTVFNIASQISSQTDLCVDNLPTLLDAINDLRKRKILKRLPDVGLYDLENALRSAEFILRNSEEKGIGITTCFDEDFPKMLKTTIDENGKDSVPLILYYKGNLSAAHKPGLAVIGTREPTGEGVKAAEYLSGEFAKKGFNIVSGLALGCDTHGHIGALSVGGATTAFLAHGLDSIYPSENEELAQRIIDSNGLLMSEYPVGIPLNKYFLVARDRLQAGLARATLVVQTGMTGGTLHASLTTLKANKPLYCVWYKDEATRNDEHVAGNAMLVNKGATYIKGDTDLNEIANKITSYLPSSGTLFT